MFLLLSIIDCEFNSEFKLKEFGETVLTRGSGDCPQFSRILIINFDFTHIYKYIKYGGISMDNLTYQSFDPKNKQIYCANLPYPCVKVCKQNTQYARIMQSNAYSVQSEMTAINQYLYQSWMLDASYNEISNALSQIAKVEMYHLTIFGHFVVLLGGTPTVSSVQRNKIKPWNGTMVTYSKTTYKMIQDNIIAEKGAIRSYSQQAGIIQDEYIVSMLERIILDEEIHVEVLEKMLRSLS